MEQHPAGGETSEEEPRERWGGWDDRSPITGVPEHWPTLRAQLLAGTYVPYPVKRVEIPKSDGGSRRLGIPTVVDRCLQQAVLQVLQGDWDRTFSAYSYGFRPRRSAHQAVEQAQRYLADGYYWVVDLDLEKFFDRVCHDKLMARLAQWIRDTRVLKLIRAFLRAGVFANGLVSPMLAWTPQGGPLSPLLSNIVLDELDREVAQRGLRFVRYADDCQIYVRSRRAGLRVLASLTRFLTRRLKLHVNQQKSAVGLGATRTFLGFSFTAARKPKRRSAPEALRRCKRRILGVTRRTRGVFHCPNGQGPDPLSTGVAWVFRDVSDPVGAAPVRGVDETSALVGDLDAVEAGASAVCCPAETGCGSRSGCPDGAKCAWPVAAGSESRPDDCVTQGLLRLTRDSTIDCSPIA